MFVIGVDPGLSGAVAFLSNGQLMSVVDMPVEETGSSGWVKRRVCVPLFADEIRRNLPGGAAIAVIESVASRPGQGAASIFSLGDSYGSIRGALQALGVRVEFVSPSAWKHAMKIRGDKDVSRTMAIQRWPELSYLFAHKKDHGRAEAALIAAYGAENFS